MGTQAIFGLQFFWSFVAWGAVAKWLLAPGLEKISANEALSWLTIPHVFRHIGMVFLVPTVVKEPLPAVFANPAAYGDMLAAVLALVAFIALRTNWAGALALVWIFNVLGTVDLLYAVGVGTLNDAAGSMGSAWYIPTMLVPALLITHGMIFVRILKRGR